MGGGKNLLLISLNIPWLMWPALDVGHNELCLHLFAHPDYRALPSALYCVPGPSMCLQGPLCLTNLFCCYFVSKRLLQSSVVVTCHF
jgi:hypothetical protein